MSNGESLRPAFSNNWFELTAKPVWDRLIPQINPRTALEIGSFEGASACYLIEHCASSSAFELHCIDTWEGSSEHQSSGTDMAAVESRFINNTKLAIDAAPNFVSLEVHKGYSIDMLSKLLSNDDFRNFFELIYIDGSHHAPDVLADAVLSFPLLKVGGVMIFDDYLWHSGRRDQLECPKPGIDAFTNIYFRKLTIMFSPNSQVCAKKTAN